jgi:hypothetical protein
MGIAQVTLDKWSDIHDFGRRNWLFRGQRSASWDLKTSLERCFEREAIEGDARIALEAELLREFKRTFHNYALHIPGRNSVLEWLSLMQHHGAPTRLLDFNYSVYVASYFALETAVEDCAVWAIDAEWVMGEAVKAMVQAGKSNAAPLHAKTTEAHETIAGEILFKPPFVSSVLLLSPFRLNERLRIQKGTFLIPGDIASSFMDNLRSVAGHDREAHLLKIVLPARLRREALEKLHYMNISSTSLFPGLDGYARSLGIYHPAFRPIQWKHDE